MSDEKRGFTLCIKKKDKALILHSYLDYIIKKTNDIRQKNQDCLLFTNSYGGSLVSCRHSWKFVRFKHFSTFETLAMVLRRKEEIMANFRDFVNGNMFY